MATDDGNDPSNPRNKYRTRESKRQLRELLMGWDPIGVADVPEAQDEYDCMISPLLRQLHDGTDIDRLRDWIRNEVEQHFGLRSVPDREERLAVRVHNWWTVRAQQPSALPQDGP